MNRLAGLTVSLLLVGSSAPAVAGADTISFGQFFQQDNGPRPFRYGNDHAQTGRAPEFYTSFAPTSADPGSMPVFFLLSADALPLDLSTPEDDALSADLGAPGRIDGADGGRPQPLGRDMVTMPQTASADQPRDGRLSMMTVTFANAELDASRNGGAFTFHGSDDAVITYTSDFLDFGRTLSEDFGFSFSGASPKISAALGSVGADPGYSGADALASDSAQRPIGVSQASIWTSLFLIFGAVGVVMRTGRRQRDLYAA